MSDTAEFEAADPRARLQLAVALLGLVFFAALAWMVHEKIERHLEQAPQQVFYWTFLDFCLMFGAIAFLSLVEGFWIWRRARKIFRAGRVPTPGATFAMRSRVRTGRDAVRYGRLCLVGGIFLVVLGTVSACIAVWAFSEAFGRTA